MAFKAGESGNPKGRPKGVIDRRARFRGLLEANADEIIEKLIEQAKAGDSNALKLCVERLIPRLQPDDKISFELPKGKIDTGDNMLRIVNGITESVATGLISIKEAEKFTRFLEHQRSFIDEAEEKKDSEIEDAEWKKR